MRNLSVFFIPLIIILLISCDDTKKNKIETTGDNLVDQLSLQIASEPKNAELLYQRASVLYEKQEFDPAIIDLENAMHIDSLKPKYHHLLADAYLDYYKSRRALDVMEEAQRLFPERIPTLLKLSEFQLILNQNENSIYTINEILRLQPRNKEAFFMLGMNFRAMKDLDKAINSFQTCLLYTSPSPRDS